MSESDEFDLESLVAAALNLTSQRRQQFLSLLPPEMRAAILERLDKAGENRDKTLVDLAGEPEMRAAATQIVEPSSVVDSGSKTITDLFAVGQ